MSMIAMAAPSPHSAFNKRDYPWEGARSHSEYNTSQSERIALPPIRQAFPELSIRVQDGASGTTTSPIVGPASSMTAPDYVHSPSSNKRRRRSVEVDRETERSSRIPRLYASPTGPVPQRNPSPVVPPRSAAPESWSTPVTAGTTPSPYLASGGMTPMMSPTAVEMAEHPAGAPHGMPPAPESRSTTLPSLPRLSFERDAHIPREYAPRPVALSAGPTMDAIPAPYRTAVAPAAYAPHHHPSRLQSLSAGAIHHSVDHSPYGAYGNHDFVRFGDFGGMGMGMGGDDKRRKRRGNLPRITTDKLRHWFVNHLDHPYPTEDEKQELMRQTGLQMNQISNWFINARRRQLPQLMNNARVEAASRDAAKGKIRPTTERGDYDDKVLASSAPLSDGEGYHDELGMNGQRSHIKRGSI